MALKSVNQSELFSRLRAGETAPADTSSYASMSRAPIPFRDGHPVFKEAQTGRVLDEKPEEMTHLRGNLLVSKTHPEIAFRGRLDSLTAETLCIQAEAREAGEERLAGNLQEVLDYIREILGAEVKEGPLPEIWMENMDAAEIRYVSHHIREYVGIDHPIPDSRMGYRAMELNRLRTAVRETELSAVNVYTDQGGRCTRRDIVEGLNRLSSYVYLLFCREAAESLRKTGEDKAEQESRKNRDPLEKKVRLITETEAAEMVSALRPDEKQIVLGPDAVVTPSGRDVFWKNRIEIIRT